MSLFCNFLKTRKREEQTLLALLTLDAGYDIGLLGRLTIRSTDSTWEVEQELSGPPRAPTKSIKCVDTYYDEANGIYCWSFNNPVDAVKFFLELRHKEEIGIDYDFLDIGKRS